MHLSPLLSPWIQILHGMEQWGEDQRHGQPQWEGNDYTVHALLVMVVMDLVLSWFDEQNTELTVWPATVGRQSLTHKLQEKHTKPLCQDAIQFLYLTRKNAKSSTSALHNTDNVSLCYYCYYQLSMYKEDKLPWYDIQYFAQFHFLYIWGF